jgi:hypothetical protein
MKSNSKIVSALFIGSLFLSSSLVAQEGASTAELDASVKTQPLDSAIDTQPVDSDIDTQGTSNFGGEPLRLSIEGHDFTIHAGEAGELCAILVGLELMSTPLLGGAELHIAPLLVLAQGRFDESGEFTVRIGYDAKMVAGYKFYLQAIAYESASRRYWTSNVETLDFSGTGSSGLRAPGDGDVDGDVDGDRDGDDDSAGQGGRSPRAVSAGDRDSSTTFEWADPVGIEAGVVGTHN